MAWVLAWLCMEQVSTLAQDLAWFGTVQYLGWNGVEQVVERAELSQERWRGRLGRHVSAEVDLVGPESQFKTSI